MDQRHTTGWLLCGSALLRSFLAELGLSLKSYAGCQGSWQLQCCVCLLQYVQLKSRRVVDAPQMHNTMCNENCWGGRNAGKLDFFGLAVLSVTTVLHSSWMITLACYFDGCATVQLVSSQAAAVSWWCCDVACGLRFLARLFCVCDSAVFLMLLRKYSPLCVLSMACDGAVCCNQFVRIGCGSW